MQFTESNCQLILDGKKTMTRRIVKGTDQIAWSLRASVHGWPPDSIIVGGRLKWRAGNVYAICPGRGKKAVGRIRITAIRREKLQDISAEDCEAEGVRFTFPILEPAHLIYWGEYRDGFKAIWDGLYANDPVKGWEANPDVWVIGFELVTD